MHLSAATERFFLHCSQEKHLAQNTVRAYRQDLAEFRRHAGDGQVVAAISPAQVLIYRTFLLESRRLEPATVKRRLASLRALFAWLVRRELLKISPFAQMELQIRLPERLPRSLESVDVCRLMRRRATLGTNCALATGLFVATGMRVGELSALRLDEVDARTGRVLILGKGSRERVVFVTDPVLRRELHSHVESRYASGAGPEASLLVGRRGRQVSTAHLRHLIVSLGRLSGVARRVTPHMLRHTAATMLLESGTDIRFVQRLLGHRSIVTTQLYTYVSDRALESALARANILGQFRGTRA
jgi:site-specific recombinase XerD